MHMHWGSPSTGDKGSEHLVNNDQYTMEIHLVHFNDKYADGAAALASGDRDALAGTTFSLLCRLHIIITAIDNDLCGQRFIVLYALPFLLVFGVMYVLDEAATGNPSMDTFLAHVDEVKYGGDSVDSIPGTYRLFS